MMDEKVIRRGDVWFVYPEGEMVGKGVISSSGRPAVIISSDYGNEKSPVVNIVYMTTNVCGAKWSINVPTYVTGRVSYVMCNQIETIDKSRLQVFKGKLSDAEMAAVEKQLRVVLDLEQEKVPKSEPKDNTTLRMELDFYRRAYNKLLDEVVANRIREEMTARMTAAVEPVEPVEEIHTEEPVFDGKLNINEVKARDLMSKLGMPQTLAYRITGTRKKIGEFEKLEDLLIVDGFTPKKLDLYKERLTV